MLNNLGFLTTLPGGDGDCTREPPLHGEVAEHLPTPDGVRTCAGDDTAGIGRLESDTMQLDAVVERVGTAAGHSGWRS